MLTFRLAGIQDLDTYFKWSNDAVVRQFSYNTMHVLYEEHIKWFEQQLSDGKTSFYIFENDLSHPVGQVRIRNQGNNVAVISISVDDTYRGHGYSSQMIEMATHDFLLKNPDDSIAAYILKENAASYRSFLKAGFVLVNEELINGKRSFLLNKRKI